MQEFIARLVADSLPALEALVCAALSWALFSAAAWVRSRAKTDEARELIDRLAQGGRDAVIAVERVVVPGLVRDAVSGKLDGASALRARAAAVEALRAQLGPAGEARLAQVLGVVYAKTADRQATIERALIATIEAALSEAKGAP
jgi:hypothetical protein